jgi:hypothetical protein
MVEFGNAPSLVASSREPYDHHLFLPLQNSHHSNLKWASQRRVDEDSNSVIHSTGYRTSPPTEVELLEDAIRARPHS